ncbi:MAG: PepSY-like domain-containing protein [Bacteroidia bacterium]
MKRLVLVFSGLFLVTMCFSQRVSVPQNAENDLKARFPKASNARWEKEGSHFEAEWKENGLEVAVIYDVSGKWIMTERQIPVSDLPESVTAAVLQSHPSAEILEAESQERAIGITGYQTEIRHAGKVKELTFDANGNIIADEIEGEDEDGDEEDDD